eukprot:TRINITY_DN9336_c0_g1_i4.p1 TRINITY_DN9336_c0_g1~~TRINITY_DN9336_c0_g1_i4.p1  ORF type:complete len:287 (+),score=41.25 TRINITY_DN9336_c0_g1_i4:107-967(+)
MGAQMQDSNRLLLPLVQQMLVPIVRQLESIEKTLLTLREEIGRSAVVARPPIWTNLSSSGPSVLSAKFVGAPSESPIDSHPMTAKSLSSSSHSQSCAPVSPEVEHSQSQLSVGDQSRRSDDRPDGSISHIAVQAAKRDLPGIMNSNDDEEVIQVGQGLGPKEPAAKRTRTVRGLALASLTQSTVARRRPSVPGGADQRLSAAALAAMPPAARKRTIGEKLYPRIYRHQPELAGKLTGMLLELRISELLMLLRSDSNLQSSIDGAMSVLRRSGLEAASIPSCLRSAA